MCYNYVEKLYKEESAVERRRKKIYFTVVAILVLTVTAAAVWFLVSNVKAGSINVDLPNVTKNQTTKSQTFVQTTVPSATVPPVTQPPVTSPPMTEPTKPAVTVTSPYTTGFFNVVTENTVSDDDSLAGLTGESLKLGKIILAAGFRYDKNQGIFYSDTQSWQRNFGYTSAYDAMASVGGMYYDTIRLKFTYGEHDYMFQLWKGRYGITTGAEMGLYYKDKGASDKFYKCAPDSEMIVMSFALYRNDELYMTRGPERHWWLTGFKLFDVAPPDELTMHCTYFMENTEMADELEKSVIDYGFIKNVNYQRVQNRITVVWN